MASKPASITSPTIHLVWDKTNPFKCPLCESKLTHEYNDGGRKVETLKGPLWVVTNYYKCSNPNCDLNHAFPIANKLTIRRKRFGLDVWSKVIQHRFKHKLNYSQIKMVMWDDWDVSISHGAIRDICEYFEAAGAMHLDQETLKLVRASGKIVLSLDGAQPKKGRPAFWVFTDRITGRILATRYLEVASAEVLVNIFQEIELHHGVPIIAVISDKQSSIVNAVKKFKPDIPHAFCQYHFLDHVLEPIASKDSYLLKKLRAAVRTFSIVINKPSKDRPVSGLKKRIYHVFEPIAEELLCAVSTRGDRFNIFPGLEAFANLRYIYSRLSKYTSFKLDKRIQRSLKALVSSLGTLLIKTKHLASEISTLLKDFNQLRSILGHREWSGQRVKKKVDAWSYKLSRRLKRRDAEYRPERIKWMRASATMSLTEAWQQWIRLVRSYESGLYHAYDHSFLEHTNNAKENLFSRAKHHFRSTYGRDDIQDEFERHADPMVRLLDFDYEPENIKEVLLASETALINAYRNDLSAVYILSKRKWRIREEDTGNFSNFESRLNAFPGNKNIFVE